MGEEWTEVEIDEAIKVIKNEADIYSKHIAQQKANEFVSDEISSKVRKLVHHLYPKKSFAEITTLIFRIRERLRSVENMGPSSMAENKIRKNALLLVAAMEELRPDIWLIFLYTHGLDKALSRHVTQSPFADGSPVERPLLLKVREISNEFGQGLSPIELHRCLLEAHTIADELGLIQKHFNFDLDRK